MSSISAITDRATLLAEARSEWLQRARSKADATGGNVPQVPSDPQLIAQDVQLAKDIAKAEQAAEEAANTITQAATSSSSSSSSNSSSGHTLNILA